MTEGTFSIKARTRNTLDTYEVVTEQVLMPYTGIDHSSESMSSAVAFWHTHNHPAWHEDGLCRYHPQEVFYGSEDRSNKARHHPNLTVDEVAKARRICNACPVQMECLDYAIRNREEFGIWGGSTAGQRKKWIKQFEAHLEPDLSPEVYETYDEVYGGYAEEDANLANDLDDVC
jgi:WhiB family redox-sensing transcriptional regulator